MKTYKYTDPTNRVVHVIDEDGISRMSMLAEVLSEGTVIEPADPIIPVIPTVVSMRQARLALHRQALLDSVNSAVQNDMEAQIEWEYATEVRRDSTLVQSLAAGLNLTEQQMDDLFTLAASL
jgi:hypothetical protein